MDIEDILKLMKFWRIFKNLKNFKSGGLRVKFKSVATVFALGFSGLTYLFYADIGVEALELTPQDQPVLQACLDNHKRLGMSFQGRITNQAGCGCTAKMVTASIDQEHLNVWAQAHALLLHNYEEEWSVTNEAQAKVFEANKKRMFTALQNKSDMPVKLYSEMIERLEEIDTVCDSEETYEEANIVQVAALRPIGYVEISTAQLASGLAGVDGVEIKLRGTQGPVKTASK